MYHSEGDIFSPVLNFTHKSIHSISRPFTKEENYVCHQHIPIILHIVNLKMYGWP